MMIVLLVLCILAGLGLVFTYNDLIAKKNNIDNCYGSIDAMLKKRYDLIPNLVDTVKTYMTHEKEMLTSLTELRAKAISGSMSEIEKSELDSNIWNPWEI